MVSKVIKFIKMGFDLRDFLKETLLVEQCREEIKKRIENRGRNFLETVENSIYGNRKSPYLKLLKLAGCDFNDIKSSVSTIGMEKTLQRLHESGVFLTYEEFKGRKDVVRGGKSFRFQSGDFDNPCLARHLRVQSGGTTTGAGVSIFNGFEFYRDIAVNRALVFEAHGLWEIPFGIWYPILPSSTGVGQLLHSTKIGKVPSKWYSQIDREYIRPVFMQKLHTNWLIYAGRFWGTPLPKPEYVNIRDAGKIARWISEMMRQFNGCCLATFPSSAVRVCHAAKEMGLDIAGAKFFTAGEPVTPAKVKEINSAGAQIIPQYAFAEGGTVGYGCAHPKYSDEVHFQKDYFAMIQQRRIIPGYDAGVDSILLTSFLPSAPKILLNVEIGDYATLETRSCGCGFEEIGLHEHIHSIGSFEKLNSEGMTLTAAQLIRLIEEVLPRKFGGTSTDYQILEEEDSRGISRLNILASPGIGVIDESDLLETIHTVLRTGKKSAMKADILAHAETFHVKRMDPISTAMGKILPLRVLKKSE